MKNWQFILLVIAALFVLAIYMNEENKKSTNLAPTDSEQRRTESPVVEEHAFEDLLDAIEWVESKGDANAIGDGGEAVGCMQIHKIYVDDVNRIMAYNEFKYPDYDQNLERIHYIPFTCDDCRRDRQRSRAMVRIYLKHYGGTFEEMARKHNGGPQGHKKESTKEYWEKVKNRLSASK